MLPAGGKRVYPRVCGGTLQKALRGSVMLGLSPRVRGNPQKTAARPGHPWSIPACAGEPGGAGAARSLAGVYPRVCGGTWRRRCCPKSGRGLSPRVRGNQSLPSPPLTSHGSIPACAGEPQAMRVDKYRDGVYPRVCGGTDLLRQTPAPVKGLSPRVRGNRRAEAPRLLVAGSIPACAGEPGFPAVVRFEAGVYPRVCGGTWPKPPLPKPRRGLSPRVRGNPERLVAFGLFVGSIPACAGEPAVAAIEAQAQAVYPRVCGGTAAMASMSIALSGLSPRVRGNRGDGVHVHCAVGSIPACAGEPVS